MKVVVVIPVGPGHKRASKRAVESVHEAWAENPCGFRTLEVLTVPDPKGALGRSRARNIGLDTPADWHFLLDADDTMMPAAFALWDPEFAATFGSICLDGKVLKHNIYPVDHGVLRANGARNTIAMGCFVRGDLGVRFDESMDCGEDYDFYMRLPNFTKRKEPLVDIGYRTPSAGGPRGYDSIQWIEICDEIVARYPAAHAATA